MSTYSSANFETDAELLFTHLQTVRIESPDQLLDRCRRLFIDGFGYSQPAIQQAVYRLVLARGSERRFNGLLNRCCYILINYWSLLPDQRGAIAQLVELFEQAPAARNEAIPVQRLYDLVQQFTQSRQYEALKLRAWALREPRQARQNNPNRLVGELIGRYPFLYQDCLLEFDSSEWGRETVRRQQIERENQFEDSLLRYTRQRLAPSQRQSTPAIENPTLLDSAEVEASIRQFTQTGVGSISYHDAARLLVMRSQQCQTYHEFKLHLYEELTRFVRQAYRLRNPGSQFDYGGQRFNLWLYQQLQDTLPHCDHLRPQIALRVQTCVHLLDLLLDLPHEHRGHHFIFTDLTTNIGAMFTVGLLLKIVLICHDGKPTIDPNLKVVKSHLAQCFAALFKHYEKHIHGGVDWLVDCLENWMIAASIHFGNNGLSWWVAFLKL